MSILTTEQFVDLMIKWGNFKARCKSNFAKTEEAKRNEELRDKYKGKRCFIIGNGASIKNQDLSLLENEIVFAVNGFYRYEKYYDAKPDFYCMVDAMLFKSEVGNMMLAGIDKIKYSEHKPTFILPYSAKEIVHTDYKWDEWTSIYYIDGPMSFVDNYSKVWDITKPVPSPQCVVQVAMLLATFMGFEEIYLLGVEQTDIIDCIEAYLGNTAQNYAYDNPKNEGKSYFQLYDEVPLELNLRGYARIFQLYKEIYNYCIKQGVKVFNCTPKTLINTIPKKDFNSVFEK